MIDFYMRSDKVSEDKFFLWYNTEATEEEKKLYGKILDNLSKYFMDMLFKKDTCSGSLLKVRSDNSDKSTSENIESVIEELEYYGYNDFKVKIESMEDCDAYYDVEEKYICISPKSINDDSTILHEMIHLHENLLDEQPKYFHDCLLWALYSHLKGQFDNLDELITENVHIINEKKIYDKGGNHDILFLLKSLDLDIRMGYPMGTVFGYDMVKKLEGLKRKS